MGDNKRRKVFVYGTLLDTRPNSEVNHVTGQMISLGGFPAVMLDESKFKFDRESYLIEGQLLEIDSDEMGEHIDSIEGIPYLYTKEIVTTKEGNEVYIYQGNSAWGNHRQIKPDSDGIARWKGSKSRWSV